MRFLPVLPPLLAALLILSACGDGGSSSPVPNRQRSVGRAIDRMLINQHNQAQPVRDSAAARRRAADSAR